MNKLVPLYKNHLLVSFDSVLTWWYMMFFVISKMLQSIQKQDIFMNSIWIYINSYKSMIFTSQSMRCILYLPLIWWFDWQFHFFKVRNDYIKLSLTRFKVIRPREILVWFEVFMFLERGTSPIIMIKDASFVSTASHFVRYGYLFQHHTCKFSPSWLQRDV